MNEHQPGSRWTAAPATWQATRLVPMLLLMVLGLVLAPAAAAQQGPALSGSALVTALRGGGYNIYFRHAATDWSADDQVAQAGDWTSCDAARMRQLSPAGRETSREIGTAIRALRIPIGRVLASPYCRAVETARQMALGPVEPTTDIMNLRVAEYFGGASVIAERARRRLATAPTAGSNTVLVAHGNVLQAATNVYPAEAEAIVFQPEGGGGYAVVARISAPEWARLAAELGSRP